MNGSWEKIYTKHGRVQLDVLDTVIQAADIFRKNGLKNILDLGCGTGRHTLLLADRGFTVHACDISETGLKMTQELIEKSGLSNVSYSIQDMYNLSIDSDTLDGILCIWAQGHGVREEIAKGIQEAYRVLLEGGIFFTDFVTKDDITYGIGDEIAPDTYVGGRPEEEGIPHYYTYVEELKELFEMFTEVTIMDKIYRFNENCGATHEIIAAVVIAKK
jgi:ubiquinone/menaquinone biosynthesis C-methylase UbiE